MSNYQFNYHYVNEANQYSFYRIPKALFTDEAFKCLSCEAKVLYGLMLDRMGLSIKNNWVDENERVFIYFTLDDVIETIRCGKEKGVKLLAELDAEKGIGLIERKKQGMGRPTRIYVKSFIIKADSALSKSDKAPANQEVGKSEVLRSENPKSRLPEIRMHEVGKTDPNYTDINKTNFNHTDNQSILPSINPPIKSKKSADGIQGCNDAYETYREIIHDNIEYPLLFQNDRSMQEDVDELVELMLETLCSTKKTIRVNSENIPAEIVKSRFLKLNSSHIDYVLTTINKNTTKISNIRSYLITTLYNAYTSISHYYKSEVNHDFYGRP